MLGDQIERPCAEIPRYLRPEAFYTSTAEGRPAEPYSAAMALLNVPAAVHAPKNSTKNKTVARCVAPPSAKASVAPRVLPLNR